MNKKQKKALDNIQAKYKFSGMWSFTLLGTTRQGMTFVSYRNFRKNREMNFMIDPEGRTTLL